MDELSMGQATIVYEDPDEGVVSETLDNEEIVYARDHWMVHTGTDDEGNDQMTQIPRDRVHRVDRSVEEFEQQAQTVRRRVGSIASELREKLPVDMGAEQGSHTSEQSDGRTIAVEDGDRET